MNKRMNRNRLNIGAYILKPYARSAQHIKDIAASGIDFIVCMENDRPALDLFEKYGVGAIVTNVLPGWWGGNGKNAGKLAETNPMEKYEEAAKNFVDHPAVWGIDIGDEPSALDFPYYGQVMDRVNRLFPNQFAYLNLYPNYGSVAVNNTTQTMNQLGTATYDEYIAKYCEYIPADYICYDFYLYSCSVTGHYENLCTVADACQNTGRSMWIVLQVNSLYPEKWITENQLRFQAYTAMAFGAENIIWACYTSGWWHNQVLDENGKKTEQYDKIKKINTEIHTLAEDYMHYRRAATHFVGFADHPDMASVKQAAMESVNTDVFRNVKAEDGTPLVVGQMVSRYDDGANALMICAADDPQDMANRTSRIVFRVSGERNITALSGSGTKSVCRLTDGSYAVEIASNEGVLIQVK